MNVLMFTNTFTPHVGGVARSVEQFAAEYRRRGHQVLVVAPEFSPPVPGEQDVIRIPAIQNFNGSDFSVAVPVPGLLAHALDEFAPDVIHSHHPFILGDTALRMSAKYDVPIVFTHHTQYEKYTHYVPGDSPVMKRFAVELAVGYCNLCDAVIAPSATIRQRLELQGVLVPVVDIPTGVFTELFGNGDRQLLRGRHNIRPSTFVVGHVGRLAPEKGIDFLARAVARFIHEHDDACFLVAGTGPSAKTIRDAFARRQLESRLIKLGQQSRVELAHTYAAMDAFAFASQSETQGMVLAEAMAAGTPVVAIDAPGVREIVHSCVNGFLLERENLPLFASTLQTIASLNDDELATLQRGARLTAQAFSMTASATKTLSLYERMIRKGPTAQDNQEPWSTARRRLEEEWRIWSNVADAIVSAVT